MADRARRAKTAFGKLIPREKKFVVEYCVDFNATRAAIAAGYAPNSAPATASGLVRKAKVMDALDEQLQKCGVTEQRIICALAGIAFGSNLADYQPYLAGEKDLTELQAEGVNTLYLRSVSSTDVVTWSGENKQTRTTRKVEVVDRLRALSELCRVMGMIHEKRDVNLNMTSDLDGLPDGQLYRQAHAAAIEEGAPGE